MYIPDENASDSLKQKLIAVQGEIGQITIMIEISTLLSLYNPQNKQICRDIES